MTQPFFNTLDLPGGPAAQRPAYNPPRLTPNFVLDGDRPLARTWKQRTADNLLAIALADKIEAEQRDATPEEQSALIRFVGFGAGPVANGLFPVTDGAYPAGWEKMGTDLAALVSPADYKALSRSTQYAHYTPELLVRAMWRAVQRLGFAGGEVLEPGCGTGMFPATVPAALRDVTQFTLVERDPITARIAAILHPLARVIPQDFSKVKLPAGSFDLAIGNPPFSQNKMRGEGESGTLGLSMHDYFIARSVELLAPGGVAAFVVSRYTMDKETTTAREAIASMADLVGAFRLPERAMRDAAGTDVVVDILFLRRRAEGETPGGEAWDTLAPVAAKGTHWHQVNRYFAKNPGMVLGAHAMTTGQFGPAYTVLPWHPTLSLADALDLAVGDLPGSDPVVAAAREPAAEPVGIPIEVRSNAEGGRLREGSYMVDDEGSKQRAAELYEAADMASGAERKALLRLAAEAKQEGGKLLQVIDGRLVPVAIKGVTGSTGIYRKQAEIIRGLVPIRDAVRWVLHEQEAGRDGKGAQAELRATYAAFVLAHGAIAKASITVQNRVRTEQVMDEETGTVSEVEREHQIEIRKLVNLAPFNDDPDWPLLASIVEYEDSTGRETKGPIFSQIVLQPYAEPVVNNPADALAVALNETGRVHLPRIAELLECSEDDAVRRLDKLVFHDPQAEQWVSADTYLSGKVKDKLAEAEAAATVKPEYARNVEALKAVQPADLLPSDISARLGAAWLPASDIEAFIRQEMNGSAKVYRCTELATWTVKGNGKDVELDAQWGVPAMQAFDILNAALNLRIPQVYDESEDIYGNTTRVLNPVATEAAKDKLSRMKASFEAWVWRDPVRSERLVRLYNDTWNTLVRRTYDGSHLTLLGTSALITPRPHQSRGIARCLQEGNTYFAHTMGAGKTITMAACIMEQKRLGMIRKPLVVVPNHMLAQWSREWLELYPKARILVADETNFVGSKRKRFMARAATGTWDAIIITHSACAFMDVPAAFEQQMIDGELAKYKRLMNSIDRDDRTSRKILERGIERLEKLIEGMKLRKDDLLTIAQVGIDFMAVDEFHEFRKLTFQTKMHQLKGIDPNGSKKSWHMYVLAKYLESVNPGRSLIAGSGTPISNTMGELYSVMRFMAEDHLYERGVEHFDGWAGTFCDTKTALEVQPSGGYKAVTRFAEFVNIPELVAMFARVADVVLKEDIRSMLRLPNMETGARQIITADGSIAFRNFQKVLAQRLEMIRKRGGKPTKGDDIVLSVIHDGRMAALDMRLPNMRKALRFLETANENGLMDDEELDHFLNLPVGNVHTNEPHNKLNAMIGNAYDIWLRTSDRVYVDKATGTVSSIKGATQMIFCDLGTPGGASQFSVYQWIKDRLVEQGVPAREIAFIHDYKSPAAKLRLYSDMNSGRVRFMLGSSQLMGTGVNAQQRLYALHHMDVPWLPAWVEQREGRIERQGNQNDSIAVFAYVTRGSMDAQMWQTLERKQRFITAIYKGDPTVRRLEDLDSQADSFAMAKAIASGDDRLMKAAGLTSDLARLRRLKSAHADEQFSNQRILDSAQRRVPKLEGDIAAWTHAIAVREPLREGEGFRITVQEKEYETEKDGGTELLSALRTLEKQERAGTHKIGHYRGLELTFDITTRGRHVEGELYIDLPGERSMRVDLGELKNPTAMVNRLDRTLGGMDNELYTAESQIKEAKQQVASYASRQNVPFAYAVELEDKEAEMAALEAELALAQEEDRPAVIRRAKTEAKLENGEDDEDDMAEAA